MRLDKVWIIRQGDRDVAMFSTETEALSCCEALENYQEDLRVVMGRIETLDKEFRSAQNFKKLSYKVVSLSEGGGVEFT